MTEKANKQMSETNFTQNDYMVVLEDVMQMTK